ncbi:GNAT family N-acetyltransferase [Pseudomonas stutzeri]|nr:GNAT family N-acetyltransferase [Stutzerimonas stutzeri]
MNSKEAYRSLCETETSIPIFSQPWWLDATAGERHWDVVAATRNGRIVATLPYYLERRLGLALLIQPALTQTLGPWLRTDEAGTFSLRRELMQTLLERLPRFDHYAQNWHYSQGNELPLFWPDFRQTTRYTYVLPDLSDPQSLWSDLQENIRREIRKATNRFHVRVRDDLGVGEFLALSRLTFARQGMSAPYSSALVERLDRACHARKARKILIAEDDQGRRHAGIYLVWDENSAYYLMGGGDPELRNSGATSLCMWEAIRFASTVTRRFDFEGSMLEPVERFFRAFGALQQPYPCVSSTPSRLLRTALFVRHFSD